MKAILLIFIVFLCLPTPVPGQEINLINVYGLYSGNRIHTEYPVAFDFNFHNNTPNFIRSGTNGFKFWMTSNAPRTAVKIDSLLFDTTLAAYFDFGRWINFFCVDTLPDGTPSDYYGVFGTDTIGVGFSRLSSDGLPPGYNEKVLRFIVRIAPGAEGEFCIDSSRFPPNNRFLWVNGNQQAINVNWVGPFCFSVFDTTGVADSDFDGIVDDFDNCPNTYNPDQADSDGLPPGDACCCLNRRGNIDNDPEDFTNIVDLTYLIGYLFNQGPAPACTEEADIDGLANVNVVDLTILVGYLFNQGPPPEMCE